jgi:hypothetical protein
MKRGMIMKKRFLKFLRDGMGRICRNGTIKVQRTLLFVFNVTGSIVPSNPFQANIGKGSTCGTQRKKTKRERGKGCGR